MTGDGSDAAFAYHEPPITTILNLTGFLVVLNILMFALTEYYTVGSLDSYVLASYGAHLVQSGSITRQRLLSNSWGI